MENGNNALKIQNNEKATFEQKIFEENLPNGKTIKNIYNFYPIHDFRQLAFFKGLFFATNKKEYFSPLRCYQWLGLGASGTFGLWFLITEKLEKFLNLDFWLQLPLGIFFVLGALGLGFLIIESLNLIFWPMKTVGSKVLTNTSREYSYFDKNEGHEHNITIITYDCLHPSDCNSHFEDFKKEAFVSPIYTFLKYACYLIGFAIVASLVIGIFGWISSLPLNTILLIAIVCILLYKKNE